ncbi:hypothetical protein EAI_02518 [Harpegnathos saltator]|uniref:THAP-type domain-containing protein n=1 Tax=Harpegnathos saltator TaxID=610380 RepID=E2C5U0_HARSA|nr:hypothetical protein EAI_02518 [Harpegnathos saltator]
MRCVVPNCKSGSRTEQKRSLFRVPKDIVTWKKWEKAIPGTVKLNQTDTVAYKRQRLKQFAVPTKFNDVPTGKENCEPLDENTKRISNSQINSPGIVQSSVGVMKPSIQENSIVEAVIGELP